MDTAARIFEEGKSSDEVQVRPSWVQQESLKSLSSKLPLLPGSHGSIVFCTTLLSEKLQQRPQDGDFDVSDNHILSYNVLHDPHLKEYFQNPTIRRTLIDKGFITEDGFVKCNLMEFNNYRRWIRKLKLDKLYQRRRQRCLDEVKQRRERALQRKHERDRDFLNCMRERGEKAKETQNKRRQMGEIDR